MASTLEWQVDKRDGGTVVAASGRVDESTATEFAEVLGEHAETAGARLVVDLGGIEYMSSRGLRALTLAHRRGEEAGTKIALARPNETMREILSISRYDMVFPVADTIEEALAS
ncbi:MAG: STAS domain-containing protein [Parasphingopyxis sp.]|uniref:STAS domain-containing protein n=1 Tax=Parasphingopyxis sp. TaxID=1920299 RepID=UPI00260B992B|nr:STAS domain-containing protein [uncultured Parasphingopyxis sp.]